MDGPLAPKEWPNQKIKALYYIKVPLFFFDLLGARAEMCQIFSLVIKCILKLSDL